MTGGRRFGGSAVAARLGVVVAVALLGPVLVSAPVGRAASPPTRGVVEWGAAALDGQVPPDLTGVAKVAAGSRHRLALRTDGSIVAWGENAKGQTAVPSHLAPFIDVAAYRDSSLAVRTDGTVVSWGDAPPAHPGLTGVVAVTESLALRADGTVVAWRDGSELPGAPGGLVAIASRGGTGLVGLRADGTVAVWSGGSGNMEPPPGLSGVVAVAAGQELFVALRSDGTVVAWGDNPATAVPAGLAGVTAIAAGGWHVLALRFDGTVVGWGDERFWPLAIPPGMRTAVGVAAADHYGAAILADAPPSVSVPGPLTVAGDPIAGAAVTFAASVVDVDTPGVTVSCSPPAGATFPVGDTTVTCTASDGNVADSASFVVTVVAVPGPPGALFTRARPTAVWVNWEPAADHGSPIDLYGVFVYDAAGYTGQAASTGHLATGMWVEGLTAGRSYYLAVVARNALGWGLPAWSGWFTAGALEAPVVAAAPGDGTVYALWSDPGVEVDDRADAYAALVYDADGYTGRHAFGCPSCGVATVGGLVNGRAYYVELYAHNRHGWSPPGRSGWVIAGTPIPASHVAVVGAGPTAATVSWSGPVLDNGAPIDAIAVLAFTEPGAYADRYAVVCGTCRSATVGGLTTGLTYRFAVVAHNARGWGIPVFSPVHRAGAGA